jgi:hypothetical protein
MIDVMGNGWKEKCERLLNNNTENTN